MKTIITWFVRFFSSSFNIFLLIASWQFGSALAINILKFFTLVNITVVPLGVFATFTPAPRGIFAKQMPIEALPPYWYSVVSIFIQTAIASFFVVTGSSVYGAMALITMIIDVVTLTVLYHRANKTTEDNA